MPKLADPRLVRTHHVYTVIEAADALRVVVQTVRRWITKEGLIADRNARPMLIVGADLKSFLAGRRRRGKVALTDRQFYCLACRAAQEPAAGLVDFEPQRAETGRLTGICPCCDGLMHRFVAKADLQRISRVLDISIPRAQPRIGGPAGSLVNVQL